MAVLPAGIEPAFPPSEGGVLSIGLRKRNCSTVHILLVQVDRVVGICPAHHYWGARFEQLERVFVMSDVDSLSKDSIWRVRNMLWYLGGQLVSITGSRLQGAAQGLLVVSIVSREEAAAALALVWTLALAPTILLGPFIGIILDRFSKRAVLVVTSAAGTLQALVFAYLTYTGHIALWHIDSLALIYGIVTALEAPGRTAILKDAVTNPEHSGLASRMLSSIYNIAQVVGPGFAGILIVSYGYPITFLLNALSFLVLIVALANMSIAVHEHKVAVGAWASVRDGAVYTFSDPAIRLCVLLTFVVTLFGFSYAQLLVLINKYMLGGTEITFGYLAASSGFGSLLGALFMSATYGRIRNKVTLIGGLMLNGSALVGLWATTNMVLVVVLVFAAGAGFVVSFSTLRSSTVRISKKEAMGAVSGNSFSSYFAGLMLSGSALGILSDYIGLPAVLCMCGVMSLLLAALAPLMPGINELDKPKPT